MQEGWGIEPTEHEIGAAARALGRAARTPVRQSAATYSLRRAQALLQERFQDSFQSYRMTWAVYRDCVKSCKLYDYTNHAWLDFRGQVTARVPLLADAAPAT